MALKWVVIWNSWVGGLVQNVRDFQEQTLQDLCIANLGLYAPAKQLLLRLLIDPPHLAPFCHETHTSHAQFPMDKFKSHPTLFLVSLRSTSNYRSKWVACFKLTFKMSNPVRKITLNPECSLSFIWVTLAHNSLWFSSVLTAAEAFTAWNSRNTMQRKERENER